ncbi:MAG: hypothetical protein ACRC14_03935, partial [Paracoccaceae bacterium]
PTGITWQTFFTALECFWGNRDDFFQPMNVGLRVLHSSDDMLWRFFVTLPTLDKCLPKPEVAEDNARIEAMQASFFQHVAANIEAEEFCRRFMHLGKGAKPPTFAMKLDPAISRIRAQGWHIPEDASKKIKRLRDRMAHSARLDVVEPHELWSVLVAAVAVLIGEVFLQLGIPLSQVNINLGSNYRAIGQLQSN